MNVFNNEMDGQYFNKSSDNLVFMYINVLKHSAYLSLKYNRDMYNIAERRDKYWANCVHINQL